MTNQKTGILTGASCYLAGGMQFAQDNGIGWRNHFINMVDEKEIDLTVFDPTNKDQTRNRNHWSKEIKDEQSYAIELKKNKNFDMLTQHVHNYRRYDLRLVDQCDLLVICVDTKIHLCGSYDELFQSERQKRPIFGIFPQGIDSAPDWLFDVLDWRTEMFQTTDECVNHLANIDKGLVELDSRWVLVTEKHFIT